MSICITRFTPWYMDVILFNELITLSTFMLCFVITGLPFILSHWTVHKHLQTLHASLKVELIIHHDIADDTKIIIIALIKLFSNDRISIKDYNSVCIFVPLRKFISLNLFHVVSVKPKSNQNFGFYIKTHMIIKFHWTVRKKNTQILCILQKFFEHPCAT